MIAQNRPARPNGRDAGKGRGDDQLSSQGLPSRLGRLAGHGLIELLLDLRAVCGMVGMMQDDHRAEGQHHEEQQQGLPTPLVQGRAHAELVGRLGRSDVRLALQVGQNAVPETNDANGEEPECESTLLVPGVKRIE